MGRPFASFPCEKNGALLLFLTIDFELLYWSIFWKICLMLSIVAVLLLVVVEMLWEQFYYCLIPLQIDTDRRVPFDSFILSIFRVQFNQPCCCWNLRFQMLVGYWDDLLLVVGSWTGQSLHMFYRYLFFRTRFWVLC